MDFKGHFAHDAGHCHPLTLLDDHLRFSLCLEACANQRGATVAASLVPTFERYGLPRRMVFDNGSPRGNGPRDPYTPLGVWLLRLGIAISHSRPYHPQTLGKDERFHRSLKAEVLQGRRFRDLGHCRKAFAAWRHVYNLERPHEALDMAVPASRYQPNPRAYPPTPPAIEYAAGDRVRKVQHGGRVDFMGKAWRLPKAFRSYPRRPPHPSRWRLERLLHDPQDRPARPEAITGPSSTCQPCPRTPTGGRGWLRAV